MTYYIEQMKAAYILKGVSEFVERYNDTSLYKTIMNVYDYDSYFDVVSNFIICDHESPIATLCKVAKNIVQRGFPTLAPKIIEEVFSKVDIKDKLGGDETELLKALYFNPKFDFSHKYTIFQDTGEVDANLENKPRMLSPVKLPETTRSILSNIGNLAQYVQFDKSIEAVWKNSDISKNSYVRYLQNLGDKFCLADEIKNSKLNFAVAEPGGRNYVFTCNGNYKYSNETLDVLNKLEWKLENTIPGNDSCYTIKEFGNSDRVLDCVRMPLYSARITLLVLHLIEHDVLPLTSAKSVDLLVNIIPDCHERTGLAKDAFILGAKNAINILQNLLQLQHSRINLGQLHLRITEKEITFDEYIGSPVGGRRLVVRNAVVINADMSRRLYAFEPEATTKPKTIWLYSSYGQASQQSICNAEKVKYRIQNTEKDIKALEYFLNDIFDKEHFRPKQFDIVSTALNGSDVVGVLPTGSGKSITFQLSALLQPGTALVVAPLISLMNDQVANLRKLRIDYVVAINSASGSTHPYEDLLDVFKNRFLFVYIAPERLQIGNFKDNLPNLNVSYVVVDEAHCVSQWGHDFRTSYLRVGEIARNTLRGVNVIALTGTASCNVITDIKGELGLKRNVNIVTPSNFHRNELKFRIWRSPVNTDLGNRIGNGDINEAVDYAISSLDIDDFFKKSETGYVNAGLVFNAYAEGAASKGPTRKVVKGTGVTTIKTVIKDYYDDHDVVVDCFHGQMGANKKILAQNNFINGKTAILAATSAFGMGIDKPNIRFTVHTYVPASLENFYQEAGRAGRDGKEAINVVVAPPEGIDYLRTRDSSIHDYFFNISFPDKLTLKSNIKAIIQKTFNSTSNVEEWLLRNVWNNSGSKSVNIVKIRQEMMVSYKRPGDKGITIALYKICPNNTGDNNNKFRLEESQRAIGYRNDYLVNEYISLVNEAIVQKLSAILEIYKLEPSVLLNSLDRLLRNPLDTSILTLQNRVDVCVGESIRKYYVNTSSENIDEKCLYYLSVLGVYKDYEALYQYAEDNSAVVKVNVVKVNKDYLYERIRSYIKNYETKDYVNRIVTLKNVFGDIVDENIESLIVKAADYIIDYSYDKIRNFRMQQAKTMYDCMKNVVDINSDEFMDNVYRYFESKYDEELTRDMRDDNINKLRLWIDKIETENGKDNQNAMDNYSHLRASCRKAVAEMPQAFTPYFLYAYAQLGDDSLSINEAVDYYVDGLEKLKALGRTVNSSTRSNIAKTILLTRSKERLNEILEELSVRDDKQLYEFKQVLITCSAESLF